MALYGPRTPIDFTIGSLPLRRRHHVHAHGDLRRAAVRDAPVRRPHGAAGADRARPRSSRTRRGRSARASSRPSGASCCRSSCPGSCPGSRWPSRARSARSARSSSSPATSRSRPRSPRSTSSTGSSRTPKARPPSPSCCSLISFAVLLGDRRGPLVRHEARAWVGTRLRVRRARLPDAHPHRAARDDGVAHRRGPRRRLGGDHRPGHDRRLQAHAAGHGDRRRREHGLRDRLRARDRPRQRPRAGLPQRLRRPAALASRP